MSEAVPLPIIREVLLSELRTLPVSEPKIRTEGDVLIWKTKRSYQDYAVFLRRLNESVVGQFLPCTTSSPPSQVITRTLELLDTLDRWINEIPPLETPQRFGNLAFRTWGARLEEVRYLIPLNYA
ncbi:hypothetical protein DXG01_000754 [Tephrocybe rancida]|nr:hypothetical protein DXG01_000754 [Tephrocybe rancida]